MPEEMKIFFGVLFAMGIVKKPKINSYWATEPLLKTEYFGRCMPRDRFVSILKYLRFSDPHHTKPEDRHSRIADFETIFTKICLKFCPGQNLSCDESLLLFKGRLNFKMFIRTKRARFGIKQFMLCDSRGYELCFIVYYGARTDWVCNDASHLSE